MLQKAHSYSVSVLLILLFGWLPWFETESCRDHQRALDLGSSYLSLPHSAGIPGMDSSQVPFLFWWQQFYLTSKVCQNVYVYSSLHSNRTLGSCTHHWRGSFVLCFRLLVLSLGCRGEPPLSVITFKDAYLTARSCSSSNDSIIFN